MWTFALEMRRDTAAARHSLPRSWMGWSRAVPGGGRVQQVTFITLPVFLSWHRAWLTSTGMLRPKGRLPPRSCVPYFWPGMGGGRALTSAWCERMEAHGNGTYSFCPGRGG